MAHRALDLATIGFDELGGLFLQRVAEGVVGGEEIPAVAALGHQRTAGADRQRVSVVCPVEAIGRALLAGQFGGGGTGDQIDLLLALGNALYRQRHRGGGQLHDRVDLLAVVPLPRDVRGNVRLVLVIGGHDLDGGIEYLAAEVLGSHLRCLERPLAAEIGIHAGLVVEDADLHLAVGNLGRGGYGGHCRQGCRCDC